MSGAPGGKKEREEAKERRSHLKSAIAPGDDEAEAEAEEKNDEHENSEHDDFGKFLRDGFSH